MSTKVVLLDTNVFTSELNSRSLLAPLYTKHIVGRRVAITPQTVGEARFGALNANWGTRRKERLESLLRRVHIFANDDETCWEFARLRVKCRRAGHPLHQKDHIGDLWIAATAIRWKLPLVAHDGIFIDCP